MTLPIQRVPRGLADVLSIFGGQTPMMLGDQIIGVLELLQYYGLQQRQTALANDAALAEGAFVSIIPSARNWTVLYTAVASVAVTATMTALDTVVVLQRGGPTDTTAPIAVKTRTNFGATVTGFDHCPVIMPYPMLLPPNTQISASLAILGTDATANVTIRAEFGMLG